MKNWLKSDVESMSTANDIRFFTVLQCFPSPWAPGHCSTKQNLPFLPEIHAFITFISHRWKSYCRLWPAIELCDKYKELNLRSWILSIPLQCVNTSTVITGEGNTVSCRDVLLWDQWVYCICISILCVEEKSKMINYSFGLIKLRYIHVVHTEYIIIGGKNL